MSREFCISLYMNIVLSHLWTITKWYKLIHVTFNTPIKIYVICYTWSSYVMISNKSQRLLYALMSALQQFKTTCVWIGSMSWRLTRRPSIIGQFSSLRLQMFLFDSGVVASLHSAVEIRYLFRYHKCYLCLFTAHISTYNIRNQQLVLLWVGCCIPKYCIHSNSKQASMSMYIIFMFTKIYLGLSALNCESLGNNFSSDPFKQGHKYTWHWDSYMQLRRDLDL